jgi:hypothetical protein
MTGPPGIGVDWMQEEKEKICKVSLYVEQWPTGRFEKDATGSQPHKETTKSVIGVTDLYSSPHMYCHVFQLVEPLADIGFLSIVDKRV